MNDSEVPAGEVTAGETERTDMLPEQEFDIQATLSHIRECRLAGKFEEAQDCCRQILGHDPDNSEAHLLMCALFIEGGEYQEATSWYRKMDRLKSITSENKHTTMVEKVFMGKTPDGTRIEEPTLREHHDTFAPLEQHPLLVSEESAPAPVLKPAAPPTEPTVVPPLVETPIFQTAEPAFAPPPEEPPVSQSAEPARVPSLDETAVFSPEEPTSVPPLRKPAIFSTADQSSASPSKSRTSTPLPVIPPVHLQKTERAFRRPVWLTDIAILMLFLVLLTGWLVYNLLSVHYRADTHRTTRTVTQNTAVKQTKPNTPEATVTTVQSIPASHATSGVERSINRILATLTGRRSKNSGAPVSSGDKQISGVSVIETQPPNPPVIKQPEVLKARMQVSSTPAGAAVYLDGRDTGQQTPCMLVVELGQTKSGSAKIAMELAGYLREERMITVDADKPAEVKWTLSRAPYEVEVNSTPGGGDIFLDGRDTGHRTPYKLAIDAGDGPTREVTIAVELQNYARVERKMTLGSGKETAISLSLGSPIKVPVVAPPAPVPVKQAAPNPALPPGTRAGEVRVNPKDGAAMVWVPAGEFLMGSASTDKTALDLEKPQRRVVLDGYWIYQYEVTVAQFRAFCDDAGYAYDWNDRKPYWGWNDKHPMVNVSWHEARAYAEWAGVRLPTEAQWEKAARGTDGRIYPWGNDSSVTKCNTSEKALRKTMPVGSYPAGASPYGAQDMAGNVGEWCSDWYDGYSKTALRNPTGPATGKWRILRGGSWRYLADSARCASRDYGSVGFFWVNAGFRCAAIP